MKVRAFLVGLKVLYSLWPMAKAIATVVSENQSNATDIKLNISNFGTTYEDTEVVVTKRDE